MQTQTLPLLWQHILQHGVARVCQEISLKQDDAVNSATRDSLVSSLCTRSWTIYRAVRLHYVAEETFANWRSLFHMSMTLINTEHTLTSIQENLVLQFLQQVTDMIFESCNICLQLETVACVPIIKCIPQGSVFSSLFKKLGADKRKRVTTAKKRNKKLFTSSSKQSMLQ